MRDSHRRSPVEQHGGSCAKVGAINLPKAGLIRDDPSLSPWASSASGSAHSFTVTVTAEPGGQAFTITRNADATIRRN